MTPTDNKTALNASIDRLRSGLSKIQKHEYRHGLGTERSEASYAAAIQVIDKLTDDLTDGVR